VEELFDCERAMIDTASGALLSTAKKMGSKEEWTKKKTAARFRAGFVN